MASEAIRSIFGAVRCRPEISRASASNPAVVHSGTGAYQANLGSLANGGSRFFQMFSSSLPGNASYRQDRDLTQYQALEGYVRNDTAVPLTFSLELKDYRDSNSQRAIRSYTVRAREHVDAKSMRRLT